MLYDRINDLYKTKAFIYARKVVNGDIVANVYVKKVCENWLRDLDKSINDENYKYYFDIKLAIFIEKFVALFKFTSGAKVGQSIELAGFQAFFFCSIYCWKWKDNPKKRRYREAIFFIARKNGKSFICSIASLLAMILESEAECYSIATSRQQAGISVKQAINLVNASSVISKRFKTYTSKIVYSANNSIFDSVSSEAKNTDGKNTSFLLCDEAMVVSRELKNSMTSGFGQRLSPLSIYLTTAYDTNTSNNWFIETLDYAKKVLEGEIEDDTIFPLIYCLDSEDEVHDPSMWVKSNPIIEDVDIAFDNLMIDYKKALHSDSSMKNYLIKNHNIIMKSNHRNADSYLDYDKWKLCEADNIALKDKEVYITLDLSKTTDLSAVGIIYEENGIINCKAWGFLPSESLLIRKEKFDYKLAERLGNAYITEGAIVDYNYIEDFIMNLESKYGLIIKGICADFYNAIGLLQRLSEKYEVIEIRQTFSSLSPATKEFRNRVYLGQVRYEKNNLLDWCMSNCLIKQNAREDIILSKGTRNSNNRIDLVDSLMNVMAQIIKD